MGSGEEAAAAVQVGSEEGEPSLVAQTLRCIRDGPAGLIG